MNRSGYNSYRQSAGNALISKDQILLKLYAGSLNFLGLVRRAVEENNPKVRGENISKVIAILTELDAALDIKTGGEIAENLSMLYRHMMYRLTNVSARNDLEALSEVEMLLTEIKEGFDEAAQSQKKRPTVKAPAGYPSPREEKGFSYAV